MESLFKTCLLFYIAIQSTVAITTYYMDDKCGDMIDMPSSSVYDLELKLTWAALYSPNMDCVRYIRTTVPGEHLMLYFKSMNIESSSSCSHDWLELFDGSTTAAPYINGLYGKQCGYYTPDGVYTTNSSSITLHFVSDKSWQNGGFTIIITRYHTGSCNSDEYDCDNGRCIDDDIRCDGYNPCGDYSSCPELLAAGIVAVIVISSIVGCVAITIGALFCRRRRTRRFRAGEVSLQSGGIDSGPNYGT